MTMASELAANTLHAQRQAGADEPRSLTATAVPEIWLYLRGTGRTREIVCKVFDAERDWTGAAQTGLDKAPLDSVSGRGLQVVDGLSAGLWGCHPSCRGWADWKVRARRSGSPSGCRPRRCRPTSAGRATARTG